MFALLAIALVATPGPIDRLGGHTDHWTGYYHIHAAPSYQFRYIDMTGQIWEGQGPRPEENLLIENSFLFDTPFVPIVVLTAVIALVFSLWAEKKVERFRYRRMVHAAHAHARELIPAAATAVERRWYTGRRRPSPRRLAARRGESRRTGSASLIAGDQRSGLDARAAYDRRLPLDRRIPFDRRLALAI